MSSSVPVAAQIDVANQPGTTSTTGAAGRDSTRPGGSDPRIGILDAAAHCFMENGFSATSIDDVARSLGATKGMIYHHFRSKTDLFFDVYRRGMEINFAAVDPYAASARPALERLALMGIAHTIALMEEQAYQRVLAQGVAMHQQGSTTASQRETLSDLIDIRNRYEAIFRETIEAAARETGFELPDASLASKSFLAVLNSTVFWYRPRAEDSFQEQLGIAQQLVEFALKGLGSGLPDKLTEEFAADMRMSAEH